MRRLAFRQVDVFTAVPFRGNPVAVVLDGDALSGEDMQRIATWTNLSETTFVCAPREERADYRLRIFTPRRELPFAGHPTIGSAHAVLQNGLQPRRAGRLVQECGRGLVNIRITGERLFLALPEPRFREPGAPDRAVLADALALVPSDILRAAVVDVGPVWWTAQLASAETVTGLIPDMAKIAALGGGVTGVTVFGLHPAGAACALEVRSFAPAEGVPEDPVCGSGNGCVAALIRRESILDRPSYIASQGCCVARDGRIAVEFDGETIWLGGDAVTCLEGTLLA